jgi:hypothetical protein
MRFFILGAPDPEMREIERVLKEQGLDYAYAAVHGRGVDAHEAYSATGLTAVLPAGRELVYVECMVIGLPAGLIIDHHNEGDPGFGKLPHEYATASSLGQTLALLELTPTPEQLVMMAADHCLAHAYRGLCPGVAVEALTEWRVRSRALARGLTETELRIQIEAAKLAIAAAPTIRVGNADVAWFDDAPKEVSEASAQSGLPYAFMKRQRDGRMMSGIKSAPPEVIAAWMRDCGLANIYGDPERGFAGGYLPGPQPRRAPRL